MKLFRHLCLIFNEIFNLFIGDLVKVDESLFEEIDDLDIGDAISSDES